MVSRNMLLFFVFFLSVPFSAAGHSIGTPKKLIMDQISDVLFEGKFGPAHKNKDQQFLEPWYP